MSFQSEEIQGFRVRISLKISLICIQLLFLLGCTHVFYQPDRYLHFPPEKIGLKPEEINFKSADGTELFGWFFKAHTQPPKGTLVQFHGNGENMSSHYLSLAWMVPEGYNLFIFDYRGYGKSRGDATQEGTYLDGLAGLNQAWELHQRHTGSKAGTALFVVYGQSLGGAIAMRAMADFSHQSSTDLIVMDSTFLSYKEVAQTKLASFWLTWILNPLGSLLISDEYSARDPLIKNRVKLLVIHDKNDPVIPFSIGHETYTLATSRKDFWELGESKHVGIFYPAFPKNRERFLNFLNSLRAERGYP